MKPITLSFSPAQIATIDTLRGDLSRSEYIRRLLATDAATREVTWPDDLKPHGDNSRRYTKRWPKKVFRVYRTVDYPLVLIGERNSYEEAKALAIESGPDFTSIVLPDNTMIEYSPALKGFYRTGIYTK